MKAIHDLLNREKTGTPCISVIIPIRTVPRKKSYDILLVEKAIQQAKKEVNDRYLDHPQFTAAIDELYNQIDFIRPKKGIGLYISPKVKKMQYFDFPVKEKFSLSNTFLLKDLLFQAYYETPYQVLLISEKDVKFFSGSLDTLTEVIDGVFPLRNEDEYIYSRPTRGSSYVGHAFTKEFEKDKSQMEKTRAEQFFRKADHQLGNYLTDTSLLFIAGAAKDLSWFNEVSKHTKNIVTGIPGNYFFSSDKELELIIWNAMKRHLGKRKEQLIQEYNEKIGEKKGIEGATAIWKAVKEGKASTLLVEKDYCLHGYSGADELELKLDPPKEPHVILEDAVETIVKNVLEKNGEVVVLDNDQLIDHARMALITRY